MNVKRSISSFVVLFLASIALTACGGGGDDAAPAPAPPAPPAPTVITKFASLDNTQETTGSNSTAKGGGILTVDTGTGRIAGFLVHNVTNTTQAHIHVGARGVAGGIRVPLTPINVGSPILYAVPDNTFFPDPATDVANFSAGNLYYNVHSTSFTGGDIRGQIDLP
jgi:hypothetical protein